MRFHKQIKGVYNCGQIALCVITGKPLEEIIELVGHNGYTKTKDLARVLHKLGYICPTKLRRLGTKPELAIARLSYPNTRYWHWVVIHKDKIYDGRNGNEKGEVKWRKGLKITSYLPITMKVK